ncbi:uncharacterized protein LY79DRAFT_541540 [Colletotrichum navitas]|uniref:Uncharacterized protein n=1 Tax=Colletotrichum navitas TaxID=681940 RepID=A0AAD8Q847_9PEZI|nr:uncharacterized protein LY79DRAFT_541540 [Colletotrichum navitas]KAK1597399.1 hypothetical protein LY79DRAFT_541540 [Colletotrichum navitas]
MRQWYVLMVHSYVVLILIVFQTVGVSSPPSGTGSRGPVCAGSRRESSESTGVSTSHFRMSPSFFLYMYVSLRCWTVVIGLASSRHQHMVGRTRSVGVMIVRRREPRTRGQARALEKV